MNRKHHWEFYAIVTGIIVAGALALGVPAGTLLLIGVLLVFPATMFFLMRGVDGPGDPHRTDPSRPSPRDHHEYDRDRDQYGSGLP